jgi:hypothetical protein
MTENDSSIDIDLNQPHFRLCHAVNVDLLPPSYGWFYGFHVGWSHWKCWPNPEGFLDKIETIHFGEVYPAAKSSDGEVFESGPTQEGALELPKEWNCREQNQFWLGLVIFLETSRETLGEKEQESLALLTAERRSELLQEFEASFGTELFRYFALAQIGPRGEALRYGTIRIWSESHSIGTIRVGEPKSLRRALWRAMPDDVKARAYRSPLGKRLAKFWETRLRSL